VTAAERKQHGKHKNGKINIVVMLVFSHGAKYRKTVHPIASNNGKIDNSINFVLAVSINVILFVLYFLIPNMKRM
jgi:hypothetical protein